MSGTILVLAAGLPELGDSTGSASYDYHHPRVRPGNVIGRICLSVCLSVCDALTFESLNLESSFSVWR